MPGLPLTRLENCTCILRDKSMHQQYGWIKPVLGTFVVLAPGFYQCSIGYYQSSFWRSLLQVESAGDNSAFVVLAACTGQR